MDLWGYIHSHSDTQYAGHLNASVNQTNPPFKYDKVTDTVVGVIIVTLSVIGVIFNLTVLLTVKMITKRNCSKARLATSLFIFNLGTSDAIYSAIHIFSAITMLLGGRQNGINTSEDLGVNILCHITGALFNVTIRSSLWFLTTLTAIRYLAVFFPLRLPKLINKFRINCVAAGIWTIMVLLSIIPFTIRINYGYSKHISICTWSVDQMAKSKQAKIVYHILMIIVPIVAPGIIIIALYLQIIWKVIQLKTVHYKIKSGNFDKGPPHENGIPKTIPPQSKTSFSISSAMSYVRRPLSSVELERYERETECIDEDLIDFAVTSLHKLSADRVTDREAYKEGLVAYYISRFIVRTAGDGAFERIQSHRFEDSKRSQEYLDEECPVSLNYYDCQDNGVSSSSFNFRLRHDSSASLSTCEDRDPTRSGSWTNVRRFRVNSNPPIVRQCSDDPNSECDEVPPPPKAKKGFAMSSIVAGAMKKFMDKSIDNVRTAGPAPYPTEPIIKGAFRVNTHPESDDECSDLPELLSKHSSITYNPNPNRPASLVYQQVASRCRSNSIIESDIEDVLAATDFSSLYDPGQCSGSSCTLDPVASTQTKRFQLNSPSTEDTKTKLARTIDDKGIRRTCSLPIDISEHTQDKQEPKLSLPAANSLGKIKVIHDVVPVQRVVPVPQRRRRAKKLKVKTIKDFQAKRIKQLDLRLSRIIQSSFYTLMLVTLFCICYMPWWIISLDILHRYIRERALVDVTYTVYCNLLTISYCTILLNACFNPVIYFYFAYKQAMLDAMRMKLRRYRQSKRNMNNMKPKPNSKV